MKLQAWSFAHMPLKSLTMWLGLKPTNQKPPSLVIWRWDWVSKAAFLYNFNMSVYKVIKDIIYKAYFPKLCQIQITVHLHAVLNSSKNYIYTIQ